MSFRNTVRKYLRRSFRKRALTALQKQRVLRAAIRSLALQDKNGVGTPVNVGGTMRQALEDTDFWLSVREGQSRELSLLRSIGRALKLEKNLWDLNAWAKGKSPKDLIGVLNVTIEHLKGQKRC